MDPISSVGTGDLTRLLVGGATQQQTSLVRKAMQAGAEMQAQAVKQAGIGEVIDAVV